MMMTILMTPPVPVIVIRWFVYYREEYAGILYTTRERTLLPLYELHVKKKKPTEWFV